MGNNMYTWIDETVNPLAGECPHDCVYCYVKAMKARPAIGKKYSGEPRIDEAGLAKIRGAGKTVFVGSCTDIFAESVSPQLIWTILERCRKFPPNTYLFQTKNPGKIMPFFMDFPPRIILAVTVEGWDGHRYSSAPRPYHRLRELRDVAYRSWHFAQPVIMISVEPVMRWPHAADFWPILREISPGIISIGANTSKVAVDEPNADELLDLIARMRSITPDVRLKGNLGRILGKERLAELQREVKDG